MIVYVETNFLLELAYLQEDHASCAQILDLAAQGQIRLLMPAFCGIEARMSQTQRTRARAEFRERLRRELRELGRSQPYASVQTSTEALTRALIESGEHERQRLEAALARLLAVGEVIPTTAATLSSAGTFEHTLALSAPDALVYASIVERAAAYTGQAQRFITRNAKDFTNADIDAQLNQYGCQGRYSFAGALGEIRHLLGATP